MIAICTNPYRDTDFDITKKAYSVLSSAGFEVTVCPVFFDSSDTTMSFPCETLKLKDIAKSCTLAVAIGGDGTVLSVARELVGFNVPVIGINMGTMGFLCTVSPKQAEWTQILLKAATRGLYLGSRMMLDVDVIRNGESILKDTALNDIVVHGYGECIKTHIYINGNLINTFNGDGVIVASPTGSTGYSMSAGGPIVEPTANNLVITPICAHSLSARSYVFSPEQQVKLVIERQFNRRAYLASDGYNLLDIVNGDSLVINKSASVTRLFEANETSFYAAISDKLN